MWHGSVNYTRNGLSNNAEQASVSRNPFEIRAFTGWYDQVAADAKDLLAALLSRLEEWLRLAQPFDVYLAALHSLYDLAELECAPAAFKPVYYQAAVVARALRQLEEYRGALAVVATGLGKTVIGSDIAHRLHASGLITRVLLVAPKSVHDDWQTQLDARRVPWKPFTPGTVFRRAKGPRHHQAHELESQLALADMHTLIILDEAHFARNQLVAQEASRQPSRVYRRIVPAIRAGAKILLLTATPYGTSPLNLASLLFLLPDSSPDGLGVDVQWTAGDIGEFVRLPVVTVLGFPHVLDLARKRGDVDNAERAYVEFEGDRRYLPRFLKLRIIPYRPLLEAEVQAAFADNCFAQSQQVPHVWADETGELQKAVTDPVFNTTVAAWMSSPPAFADTIERNLMTAGGGEQLEASGLTDDMEGPDRSQFVLALELGRRNLAIPSAADTTRRSGYRTAMRLSLADRAAQLKPLLNRLRDFSGEADHKVTELGKLIWRHCKEEGLKAIVFVRKPRTALYLEAELRRTFGEAVNVESTAAERRGSAVLKKPLQRSALRHRFSPLSHRAVPPREPISVLICTDADAEGVSLQDARVVINYDLPDGGDTLFQRAGRVLRLTNDPDRDIFFYTFVAAFTSQSAMISRARLRIENAIGRLYRRHASSASILLAQVLPEGAIQDKSLDVDLDTEQFLKDQERLQGWATTKISTPADHLAVLDRHCDRAKSLPPSLHSARSYSGSTKRVFALVEHNHRASPIVFDIDRSKLESMTDLQALDLIACEPNEPAALVAGHLIEHYANEAVRRWCKETSRDIGEVRKICVMYLEPVTAKGGIESLFEDLGS
ncbi:MAG: DEAD/DEAH box helicase family protein [Gemmatimonadota bacterium]